jgi:hypothetical protein
MNSDLTGRCLADRVVTRTKYAPLVHVVSTYKTIYPYPQLFEQLAHFFFIEQLFRFFRKNIVAKLYSKGR